MCKKTIILIFVSCLMFIKNSTAQESRPMELNLSNEERCFVFSSMDWFDIVEAYDYNGNLIARINVKKESKHSQSQLIIEPFDFVYECYHYFVFKGQNQEKYVLFEPATQDYYYIKKSDFEYVQKTIQQKTNIRK